jgi:predicted sugar kinase
MAEESPTTIFARYHAEMMGRISDLVTERNEDKRERQDMVASVNQIKMEIALLRRDVEALGLGSTRIEALEKRVSIIELDSAKQSGKSAAFASLGGGITAIAVFLIQYLLQSAGVKAK